MALTTWWQELSTTIPIHLFTLSLLFVLVSLLIKTLVYKAPCNIKLNLPPSPPGLPIINHLHLLGTLPHRSLHALSKTYGDVMLLHLGQVPTLVVSSAEAAREVLQTQDLAFASRARTRAVETLHYGCTNMIFAPHGEYWRLVRRMCVMELLNLKRVQSFHFIREVEVAGLMEEIRSAGRAGDSINMGEMMIKISSSIISRCVLGKKYEGEEDSNYRRFWGCWSRMAMELMGELSFRDLFPLLGWMDNFTGLAKRLRETSEGIDAFLNQVIEEHRSSESGGGDHPDIFVGAVLQLLKNGSLETDLTLDNLKAIILDMLVGGTDTTSTILEWAMARLMQNTAKMSRAQEEVRRVIGKKAKVEEEDLLHMDYLKCIIKETLRLHAPVPFLIPRQLTESVKLQGYDIPPKTRVLINTRAIHRDPKQWESPHEFLPERFIDNQVDFKGHDFQFIPFGAGRRGCPGIMFGMAGAEYILANLLYWFDWKFPGGSSAEDLDMGEAFGLVVHKKVPLQLVPLLKFSLL